MILGVDHIAISTDNVEASARSLCPAGYETSFVESDLLNAEAKVPFLRQVLPRHAIALCRHPQSVAIEWTNHHSQTPIIGPYRLLSDQEWPLSMTSQAADECVFPWNEMRSPDTASNNLTTSNTAVATVTNKTGHRGIMAVGIYVSDIQRSLRFWRDGLQCRLIARGTTDTLIGWAKLSFRALRPTWSLDVVLVENKNHSRSLPMLDDQGATCVALLSTDCHADAIRAANASDDPVPQAFKLVVAGKTLKIALVRGPDGEIVELIQP